MVSSSGYGFSSKAATIMLTKSVHCGESTLFVPILREPRIRGAPQPWRAMPNAYARRQARPLGSGDRGRPCRRWQRLQSATSPPVGRRGWSGGGRSGWIRTRSLHSPSCTPSLLRWPPLAPEPRALPSEGARASRTSGLPGWPGRRTVPSHPCRGSRRGAAMTMRPSTPGAPCPGVRAGGGPDEPREEAHTPALWPRHTGSAPAARSPGGVRLVRWRRLHQVTWGAP
jgi:hypothetical protein